MKLMIRFAWFVLFFSLLFSACTEETMIRQGDVLSESFSLEQTDTLFLSSDTISQAALTITGENLVFDFGGLTIIGTDTPTLPDQFTGLAIEVKNGKNITIKNLNIHGFKIALLANEIENLTIDSCNFSYNYRQRLKSTREKEDLSDWLYFHQNDQDEWLRYGAGIYLRACDSATVKNSTITEGMNGLLMTRCNDGLFYNNSFHFNSGLGIGLYRSSRNRVMHNRLDWNVRGYSHGIYARGQDSAGILCYEQSNDNIFAYNSATHSGDGFFLWAGQTTMDTGKGGCNNNLIYGNDFSHAPANGIEVTFSSNEIGNNQLEDCRYGIWGGYSWETTMTNNFIGDCEVGIAIEHGQDNTISRNTFYKDSVGIKLWERDQQPEDWGYAQHKDVSSRGYLVSRNWFQEVPTPLQVNNTKDLEHKSPLFAEKDAPEPTWGIGA
jgi:parallel beta-helix repeat protein